jgi:hypothetical protein
MYRTDAGFIFNFIYFIYVVLNDAVSSSNRIELNLPPTLNDYIVNICNAEKSDLHRMKKAEFQ